MQLSPQVVSKDKPFVVFDRSSGLASSWSLSVAALPGGAAFATSLREGLTMISSQGKHQTLPSSLSPWGLSSLAEPKGVWIGTQDGAAFFPQSGAPAQDISGLPDKRVHVFFRDPRAKYRARVWIGTENGLAWLNAPKES